MRNPLDLFNYANRLQISLIITLITRAKHE